MHNALELETILNKIHIIRSKKVILDRDIANLYQVETKALNQAIRRNINRFPEDFMFQLTQEEFANLRSQIVTANLMKVRYLPYAFTEQGIAMLSSVLNSEHAILVNIQIMRAFVELRKSILTNEKVLHEIDKLKRKVERHDEEIETIILTIEKMLTPDVKPLKKIGFKVHNEGLNTKTKKIK